MLANPLIAGYVGYHRKRGGKELRRAAFEGFVPLDLFERVQEVRRNRSRLPRRAAHRRVYVLSGLARCASCAGQVTASAKQRLRCRRASQHEACAEPSVPAETVEREMGAFLCVGLGLPATLRPRLAALVRAKVGRGSDQASAERLRGAMKRLTEAYTWGGVGEADYRESS